MKILTKRRGTVLTATVFALCLNVVHAEEESVAHRVGEKVDHAMTRTGEGIHKAAQATGRGLHKAADATGRGIHKAVDATGRGLQTAGEKIQNAANR